MSFGSCSYQTCLRPCLFYHHMRRQNPSSSTSEGVLRSPQSSIAWPEIVDELDDAKRSPSPCAAGFCFLHWHSSKHNGPHAPTLTRQAARANHSHSLLACGFILPSVPAMIVGAGQIPELAGNEDMMFWKGTAHSSKERRRPLFWQPFSAVTEPAPGLLVPLSGILASRRRKPRKNEKKRGKNGRDMA